MHLLEGSTDFITVRQVTALDALGLFLEYAHADDLVQNIKKVIHYLMVVYINNADMLVRDKVLTIIELLALQLPSADIYLDVLLSRLENKYLTLEANGSITVMVVMAFLSKYISVAAVDTASFKRIAVAIEKPYLNRYIADHKETIQQYEHIISLTI